VAGAQGYTQGVLAGSQALIDGADAFIEGINAKQKEVQPIIAGAASITGAAESASTLTPTLAGMNALLTDGGLLERPEPYADRHVARRGIAAAQWSRQGSISNIINGDAKYAWPGTLALNDKDKGAPSSRRTCKRSPPA
jgi:hypothetical protein